MDRGKTYRRRASNFHNAFERNCGQAESASPQRPPDGTNPTRIDSTTVARGQSGDVEALDALMTRDLPLPQWASGRIPAWARNRRSRHSMQHDRPPPLVTAQVCRSPVAIAVTPVARPLTTAAGHRAGVLIARCYRGDWPCHRGRGDQQDTDQTDQPRHPRHYAGGIEQQATCGYTTGADPIGHGTPGSDPIGSEKGRIEFRDRSRRTRYRGTGAAFFFHSRSSRLTWRASVTRFRRPFIDLTQAVLHRLHLQSEALRDFSVRAPCND